MLSIWNYCDADDFFLLSRNISVVALPHSRFHSINHSWRTIHNHIVNTAHIDDSFTHRERERQRQGTREREKFIYSDFILMVFVLPGAASEAAALFNLSQFYGLFAAECVIFVLIENVNEVLIWSVKYKQRHFYVVSTVWEIDKIAAAEKREGIYQIQNSRQFFEACDWHMLGAPVLESDHVNRIFAQQNLANWRNFSSRMHLAQQKSLVKPNNFL